MLASGRDGEGEGDGVRAAETQVSLGSGGVRAIREGHSGLGSPAGAGPAGYRLGPSLPPIPTAAAAAAAAAELRVTKLPQDSEASHWRGRSQSESGVAVLGQEALRCTFPRHPAKHAATQSQWLTHLPCPRDTQHRLPPYAHNHSDTRRVVHTRPQEHAKTHSTADAQISGTQSQLRDTQHCPGPQSQ